MIRFLRILILICILLSASNVFGDTVYSSTNDGYVEKTGSATWAGARNATTGTAFDKNSTYSHLAALSRNFFTFGVGRSFFPFDLSGLSGTATSVSFHFKNRYADTYGGGVKFNNL